MTQRLRQPDTAADRELRFVLDAPTRQKFVMVAGAGSGKTTSLVKALDHVISANKASLSADGRRVACITYTEIAAAEISKDVGHAELTHVSTIHSFLWTVVHPFTADITRWVRADLAERIQEKKTKLSAPRTRQASHAAIESDIARLDAHLQALTSVRRWTYGTGSSYKNGILGHSDIIKMVPNLILTRPLLARVVSQRFPFVLVDESQDTIPVFVEALKHIANSFPGSFCLGFFGDPMQQIYATGVGEIGLGDGWRRIEKPENYRCSTAVLGVVNALRRAGGGTAQTPGRPGQVAGMARVCVMPSDEHRGARLDRLRQELAAERSDDAWTRADGVRVLVVVHRMAAKRLGFEQLYDAANNDAPNSIKGAFRDGDLAALRPLRNILLPMAVAQKARRHHEVMAFLRANSPLLRPGRHPFTPSDVPELLRKLKRDIDQLVGHLETGSPMTIREVLTFGAASGLVELDDKLVAALQPRVAADEDLDDPSDATLARILACPAAEVIRYDGYIERATPYATHHGVKGAEFDKVIVVIDDDEGRGHTQYSYDKLFRLKPLSKKDTEHVDAGGESVLDRTRRLFYVCCSRAREDLVVAYFAQDTEAAATAVRDSDFFPPEQVSVMDSY